MSGIPFDPQRADKPTIYVQDDDTGAVLCSIDADTGEILDIAAGQDRALIKWMAIGLAAQRRRLFDLETGLLNTQQSYLAIREDLRELATKHGIKP